MENIERIDVLTGPSGDARTQPIGTSAQNALYTLHAAKTGGLPIDC
ncbi:hypothetical protein [Novosphingobium sp. PhB165]|nr:hypothetical protein [Novosphingobium sp. PhB165]